jgi:glyoxylase-like metal-dependent hydrolase (beta-lactamase superfamily II)
MYELHHLKGNTYYIDGPTNLGLYKLNEYDVCLVDCASELEADVIYKLLLKNNFNLKYIIDTHSHPDHSGANLYLMEKTGCKVIASKIERAFFRDSKLDIGFLYGGYPLDEYDNRLMHIDDQREIYSLEYIPKGLRSFKLKGHHYGMIGIKTDDDVYFIADTLGSKDLIDKQHILLIYDVEGYLNSLDIVQGFNGNIIVPSHAGVSENITELVRFNRDKIYEIMNVVASYLETPHTIEDVVAHIFFHYSLKITHNKYLLITSTIRSYIAYLNNKRIIKNYFKDNKMYFVKSDYLIDK